MVLVQVQASVAVLPGVGEHVRALHHRLLRLQPAAQGACRLPAPPPPCRAVTTRRSWVVSDHGGWPCTWLMTGGCRIVQDGFFDRFIAPPGGCCSTEDEDAAGPEGEAAGSSSSSR